MKRIPEIQSVKKEYFTENNHIYIINRRVIINENNKRVDQIDFHTEYKDNSLCGKEIQNKDEFELENITDILNNNNICSLCKEELKKYI